MSPHWDEQLIHVIDFEGSAQSGIVEFGVVSLRGMGIESVSTRLCRPTGVIPANEEETHGITQAAAKGFAPFSDEWEHFAGLRESGPLGAHFASAENGMIKSVFPYARKSKDWIREGGVSAEWGPWIDTGALFRDVVKTGDSLSLRVLIESEGLQEELDELAEEYCPENRRSYHCALYDALASALLLILYCSDHYSGRATVQQLAILSKTGGKSRQSAEQSELF